MKKTFVFSLILIFFSTVTFAITKQEKNEIIIKSDQEILNIQKQIKQEKNPAKKVRLKNLINIKELETKIKLLMAEFDSNTKDIPTIQEAISQAEDTIDETNEIINDFEKLIETNRQNITDFYATQPKEKTELLLADSLFNSNKEILEFMTKTLEPFEKKLKEIQNGKYRSKNRRNAQTESIEVSDNNKNSFILNITYRNTSYKIEYFLNEAEKEDFQLISQKPKLFIAEPYLSINDELKQYPVSFSIKNTKTNNEQEYKIKNLKTKPFNEITLIEKYNDLYKSLQEIEKVNTDSIINYKLINIKTVSISNIDKYIDKTKFVINSLSNMAISISLNTYNALVIKADRTVAAYGANDNGQCNVKDWKSIKKAEVGAYSSVGLKMNGTTVACGFNGNGLCNVGDWKDIVDIKTGKTHTVGLKKDGTVVAVGDKKYGQCDVKGWKNIIAISVNGNRTAGLRKDGTVVVCGENDFDANNVKYWSDIKEIHLEGFATVGLKKDGTVIACGENYGNVQTWDNIVQISVGHGYIIGLKKDGTVVSCGQNTNGQCNVEDWKNITAVFAGYAHTIGLKKDGTVVATGWNEYGQCDVEDWKNIFSISASAYNTAGITKDGRALVCGDNSNGLCNINNLYLYKN